MSLLVTRNILEPHSALLLLQCRKSRFAILILATEVFVQKIFPGQDSNLHPSDQEASDAKLPIQNIYLGPNYKTRLRLLCKACYCTNLETEFSFITWSLVGGYTIINRWCFICSFATGRGVYVFTVIFAMCSFCSMEQFYYKIDCSRHNQRKFNLFAKFWLGRHYLMTASNIIIIIICYIYYFLHFVSYEFIHFYCYWVYYLFCFVFIWCWLDIDKAWLVLLINIMEKRIFWK